MIRTRIAAAMGTVALAAAATLVATTGPAEASSPPTPYMCPWTLTDTGHGIYGWTFGQGHLICYYSANGSLACRYNPYIGEPWYNEPNPAYCPARAIPTTP